MLLRVSLLGCAGPCVPGRVRGANGKCLEECFFFFLIFTFYYNPPPTFLSLPPSSYHPTIHLLVFQQQQLGKVTHCCRPAESVQVETSLTRVYLFFLCPSLFVCPFVSLNWTESGRKTIEIFFGLFRPSVIGVSFVCFARLKLDFFKILIRRRSRWYRNESADYCNGPTASISTSVSCNGTNGSCPARMSNWWTQINTKPTGPSWENQIFWHFLFFLLTFFF